MSTSRPGTGGIEPGLLRLLNYFAILALLLPGCKGGGSGPTAPDQPTGPSQELTEQIVRPVDGDTPTKAVWGFWDITLDKENGLQIVPVRGVEYTFNVNTFLQPPVGQLTDLSVAMVNQEKLFIAGDCVVDVSLTHPFPNLTQFTGFDVLGVLIGNGNYVANSDAGIFYPQPNVDTILLDADGYTRWMNPLEFTTKGIIGYTQGALGNKGMFWSATLNPYKYFSDNLSSTETIPYYYESASAVNSRGTFTTGSTNTRRYSLHFPMSAGFPVVRFQYAVIASWAEPLQIPPSTIPGDFPSAANMQEAFHCDISTVGSTLYWNSMYDHGGGLFLTLEVFDWQGGGSGGVAGQIKQIILDSPDEFINGGSKLVFNPSDWTVMAGSCANSVKIALNVGNVEPGGPCPFDNDVLVTIVSQPPGDYDNGLGGAFPTDAVLTGYARLFFDMGKVCNDPPTVWFTNCPDHTITVANRTFMWDGEDDVTPNVRLEYRHKLDNGAWSNWEQGVKQAYYENLTESQHTVYVECRDLDGQVSSAACTFSIDLPPVHMPPNVSFINCADYVRTPTYTFNLNVSDDFTPLSKLKVRYNYDSGGWVNLPDGSTQVTLNGLTSGGPHSLLVEIEDLDTMVAQAECDFSVNMSPTVLISNCPSQDLNVADYQFDWTGSDPEGDTLQYQTQLDSNPWSAWGAGLSLLVNGLTSGSHQFRVRVRDTTGGQDQTQCNLKVNFGPTISIDNPPSQDVNSTSYQFNWTASDDLDSPLTMQYNVQLDGTWQGWTTGILTYNWTPLGSGNHTFRVRVRDTGNPALTAEDLCNFIVNFKPSVSIDNCPIGVWPSADITFDWTGTDDNSPEAGMSYSYRLDAGAWSAWQLGQLQQTINGLINGDHSFDVRVRDTGTPPLACDIAPSTCASCLFTVDTNCASPPPNVNNFVATDGSLSLSAREVNLTWDALPGCVDFYDIERENYVAGSGWTYQPLVSVPPPANFYLDTDARYSGPSDVINYRIRARNMTGTSPGWSTDTGYPIIRNIKVYFWCWAEDSSGTNASTTWARAAADYIDCNTFWNGYGLGLVSQNPGNFTFITDPAYRNLDNSAEDWAMFGANRMVNTLNVYYVDSSKGNYGSGYCYVQCPGSTHTLNNIFIVLCRDTRGTPPNEAASVLAHEVGHGYARFFDEYLLDTDSDIIQDSTCAVEDTWCLPPSGPPLFCDDNACYPENPGAGGKVPKQLMWYTFATPVAQFDLWNTQWAWVDTWVHGYESNYPWP